MFENQFQFYCPLMDSTFLLEQGDDIISMDTSPGLHLV